MYSRFCNILLLTMPFERTQSGSLVEDVLKVGFIGAGNMAQAIMNCIIDSGKVDFMLIV